MSHTTAAPKRNGGVVTRARDRDHDGLSEGCPGPCEQSAGRGR
jgi:hypothetical protein